MPKQAYAFEPDGEKRLEISWKAMWKETTVTLDGTVLGVIPDVKALRAGQEFGLVVGETARFFFLGSTVRHEDKVGDVIEDWNEEIDEITTMEAHLEHEQGEGVVIPVRLHSRVTEVGTLELWCVARDGRQRWKLEFNVREQK